MHTTKETTPTTIPDDPANNLGQVGGKTKDKPAKAAKAKGVSHAKSGTLPPPLVISEVHLIPLDRIEVLTQVRTEFDEATIKELAADIDQNGLLQPVLVSPIGDEKYRLVSGERRMRAIRLLGHHGIPALITKMDELHITSTQLAENIQREDMSLKDTANVIRMLFDRHNSLETVSLLVNKSKSWVSKRLAVTHPNLGCRAKRMLGDAVCEDIELLNTFSQIENLYDHETTNKAEQLIRSGRMNRQQARDFLKATKDKQDSEFAKRHEKEKKAAEKREAKAKEPPKFNADYEVHYGIWEMIFDEEIPSVSALLSGWTEKDKLEIEQLLRPAWEAGASLLNDQSVDFANGFLKMSLSNNYGALNKAAWVHGALGQDLVLHEIVRRLWNCDPDNESRWEKDY